MSRAKHPSYSPVVSSRASWSKSKYGCGCTNEHRACNNDVLLLLQHPTNGLLLLLLLLLSPFVVETRFQTCFASTRVLVVLVMGIARHVLVLVGVITSCGRRSVARGDL
jgi:hypothetical protein